MSEQQTERSAWGRSRFGGSSTVLIATSLGAGVVLAAVLGALGAKLAFAQNFVLGWTIFAVGLLPVLSAAVWALLVDRDTLRGAPKNPEISVESKWYDRAAVGVFQDILLVGGLGAAVLSFMDVQSSIGLILAAVIALAMADFGVRYLCIKRRES